MPPRAQLIDFTRHGRHQAKLELVQEPLWLLDHLSGEIARPNDVVALHESEQLLQPGVDSEPPHHPLTRRHPNADPHRIRDVRARLLRDRPRPPPPPLLRRAPATFPNSLPLSRLPLRPLPCGLYLALPPRPLAILRERALVRRVLRLADVAHGLLLGSRGAGPVERLGVLGGGRLELGHKGGGRGRARDPGDDRHGRRGDRRRVDDQAGEGELRAVQRRRDLVGFRVLDVAGPEDGVFAGVREVLDHFGREQRVPNEGGSFVVFGGEEDDEQELEVSLGGIVGLRVPVLEEGQVVAAIFLLELADEPCRGVSRVQWSSSARVLSRGRCRACR